MKISYNWLRRYINFNFTASELDDALTMLGVEVESYQDLAKIYEGFFIGEVLSKEKHPKAEKLSLCKVRINLDGNELQVVCGAPNVAAGQKIIIGVSGAIVPSNQMRLERRKIRDHYSEGMICSQAELGLGDDHSGIWILPNDALVGQSLVEYFQLNDIILEISLTPNKVDCASHLGIARELASILRRDIHLEAIQLDECATKTEDFISVDVLDNNLCPRYVARVIKGVKNTESPDWLKKELLNIGLHPRNVVVDVTNYILMDLGHPLHAFDLDKVADNKLIVKDGFHGMKFTTLDEKERVLSANMLMICDNEKPIAVAGVMGGKNSEISTDTTNVVIESAFFNSSSVRKTAKMLGLSTEASYRFERGADIDILNYAVDKAVKMITELAGGEILSGCVEYYPKPIKPKKIDFCFDKARKVIGVNISNEIMRDIFIALGFEISSKRVQALESIKVKVPNRRVDIFGEIDLIEEIARVFNYDNIAPNYTSNINFNRGTIPAHLQPLPLRDIIRKYLSNNGFNEILTQNIIDPASAAISTNQAITIENPLGEEMSKMRPSMIAPMLKVVSFNIRQGTPNLKLFETGKYFIPQNNIINSFIDGIDEREQLIIAVSGNKAPRQWGIVEQKFDFFDTKGFVEELLLHIKIPYSKIKPLTYKEKPQLNNESLFFDENSAEIQIDKKSIGFIGAIKNTILKKYDIDVPVFIATLDLTELNNISIPPAYYRPVSQYPNVKRDLAFIISEQYSVNEIKKNILENGTELLKSIDIFDLYKGKNIEQGKRSIGFELTFSSNERTLVDSEIEIIINTVVTSIEGKFEAVLRKN